jgi:hypothetical protein
MNRFRIPLLILGLSSPLARAQVDLDRPLSVGLGDHVYRSAADDGAVYAIPVALSRVSPVSVSEDKDFLHARFDVGVRAPYFAALKKKVAQASPGSELRYFRAVSTELRARSATDIGEEFESELTPLGDTGNFAGPTGFALRVKRLPRIFAKPKGRKLFEQLFGDSGADHVGTIDYEFASISGGQPYRGKTSVSIYVGADKKDVGSPFASVLSLARPQTEPAIRILHDEAEACWELVEPGVICLRHP